MGFRPAMTPFFSITHWTDDVLVKTSSIVSAAGRDDEVVQAALVICNRIHEGDEDAAASAAAAAAAAQSAAENAYAMPLVLELLKRHHDQQQQHEKKVLPVNVSGTEMNDDRGPCVYAGHLNVIKWHISHLTPHTQALQSLWIHNSSTPCSLALNAMPLLQKTMIIFIMLISSNSSRGFAIVSLMPPLLMWIGTL